MQLAIFISNLFLLLEHGTPPIISEQTTTKSREGQGQMSVSQCLVYTLSLAVTTPGSSKQIYILVYFLLLGCFIYLFQTSQILIRVSQLSFFPVLSPSPLFLILFSTLHSLYYRIKLILSKADVPSTVSKWAKRCSLFFCFCLPTFLCFSKTTQL